jgi:MoxR-like ATPase
LYCLTKSRRDRLSVFFTFGYPNRFTEDFSRANMKRQLDQNRNEARAVPAALKENFEKAGVRIYSEAS